MSNEEECTKRFAGEVRQEAIAPETQPPRSADGLAAGFAGIERPLLAAQRRVFSLALAGRPIATILGELCAEVEAFVPGGLCTVMHVRDGALHLLARTNADPSPSGRLEGLPLGVGSCGAAAECGAPVIVRDTLADDRWLTIRDVALAVGIRACWSIPIRSPQGTVVGTFAISHASPRSPSAEHMTLLETAAEIAAVAMARAADNEAMWVSEARLRSITECSPDYIMLLDVDGTIRFINRTVEPLTVEGVIGTRVYEYVPEQFHRQMRECFARVIETGEPGHYTCEYEAPGGEIRTFESRVGPVNDGGALVAFAVNSTDVSERLRSEAANRVSAQQFHQLTETIDDVFWLTDWPENRIVYVSPAYERIWGQPRERVLRDADAWLDPIHPEDRDRVTRSFHRDAADGRYDIEYRLVGPSGEVIWIHDKAFPIQDARGRVCRIAGVAENVTERKLAAEELLRRSRRENLLLRELEHRVRNNLAALISLIDLTRRTAGDADRFASAIEGRVHAMAAVHGLLSGAVWSALDLKAILSRIVPPEARGALRYAGARVEIPFRQASAVAMVLHELLTNSVKHGALGALGGQVDVRWEVVPSAESGHEITLHWRECGGPAISEAPQAGVGTNLVRGLVATDLRGEARLAFPPGGAEHVLRFRVDGTGDERAFEEASGGAPRRA